MSLLPAALLIRSPLPPTDVMLEGAVRISFAIVVGFLVQRLLFLMVSRVEVWMLRAQRGEEGARQRAGTISQILRHACTVLVAAFVITRSLAILGWDPRPLLAGAGLVGVAIGFGAQSLVRDIISGIFILAEDQYSVGDLIEVNGKAATVEMVGLRVTRLRDFNGNLHFVPNGEMKIVTNRSRGWSRLAVDVPIAADQDLDRALEECRKVAAAMNQDPAWRSRLLDPVEVWGVEMLTGAEAVVRLVVRAKPGPDAPETARELRRRLGSVRVRMLGQRDITIRPGPAPGPGMPQTVEPS